MKKLSVLLGALLLSASPVLADDLVYLECEGKSVTTIKELKSNQILKKEETTETTHHKFDLVNSRLMSADNPQWEEVKIVDGVVVLDEESTEDGFDIKVNASWRIVPPGRFTADGLFINDTTSTTFKARGMCKGIDESEFEKALKEAQS